METSEAQKVDSDRHEPAFEVVKPISGQRSKPDYQQNAKPNAEEEEGGKVFTDLGFRVRFQRPVGELGIRDQRTAGLYVDGLGVVEIYTPKRTTSIDNILDAIQKKRRQSPTIFVQGEFSMDQMEVIAARLWAKPNAKTMETLYFRSTSGDLLRFRRPRNLFK